MNYRNNEKQLTISFCNICKTLQCGALIVIISVIVGGILMIGIYHLPTKLMTNNVKKSIPLYTKEGLYQNWAGRKDSARLDNFTDAIMLRNAIYPTSKSKMKDAMLNPRYDYKNRNQVQSLIDSLKEKKNFTIVYYPRYWHGYLIILKPLTMLCEIANIRLLNMLLQIIIATYLIMLTGVVLGKGYGLSLFLSYLLLNPVSLSMSFQYSSVFYVTFLVSIFLLKQMRLFTKKQNYFFLIFLFSGILTAFFDLLTYPIATLGIPLILYLIGLNHYYKLIELHTAIKSVIWPSVFWGMGYAGMFVGKWVLAQLLTGYNVVANALFQLCYRMSYHTGHHETGKLINPIKSISNNIQVILHEPIIIVLIMSLIISLYYLWKTKKLTKLHDYSIFRWAMGFVMLYPFIWYTIFCNHSFIHTWFTYRALSVSVFAIGSIVASLFLEYQRVDALDEK